MADNSPIPGVNAAPAGYQVPSGSPFDRALSALPNAPMPQADPAQPSGRDILMQMMANRGGDTQLAFADASDARDKDPQNLPLRDAEHELFVRQVLNQFHLPPEAALLTPAYSAAKAVGQPLGLFKGATPPSWSEVRAGVAPFFNQTHPFRRWYGDK
jgi:hypothetical protein